MGMFDNAVEKRIIKLIQRFTGVTVTPNFFAPCTTDISFNWDGWVVIDEKSIWLVNNDGVDGVEFSNIRMNPQTRLFAPGFRGYPSFKFDFVGGGDFSVYPKTLSAGEAMLAILKPRMHPDREF